jgi:PilZ domain-containing protein
MGLSRSHDLLRQAAALLPPLPATIEVLSESEGALRLRLLSHDGSGIAAQGPRLRVRPHMKLRARLEDAGGERHDLDLVVSGLEQEDGWTARLTLQVTAVHHRQARRVHARLAVEDTAGLYAISCRELQPGTQFPVAIADLSESGLAFVSDRVFHLGDVIAIMPKVSGQPVRMRARILNARPIDGGQNRVGCEVIALRDEDRRRLAELAAAADAAA